MSEQLEKDKKNIEEKEAKKEEKEKEKEEPDKKDSDKEEEEENKEKKDKKKKSHELPKIVNETLIVKKEALAKRQTTLEEIQELMVRSPGKDAPQIQILKKITEIPINVEVKEKGEKGDKKDKPRSGALGAYLLMIFCPVIFWSFLNAVIPTVCRWILLYFFPKFIITMSSYNNLGLLLIYIFNMAFILIFCTKFLTIDRIEPKIIIFVVGLIFSYLMIDNPGNLPLPFNRISQTEREYLSYYLDICKLAPDLILPNFWDTVNISKIREERNNEMHIFYGRTEYEIFYDILNLDFNELFVIHGPQGYLNCFKK